MDVCEDCAKNIRPEIVEKIFGDLFGQSTGFFSFYSRGKRERRKKQRGIHYVSYDIAIEQGHTQTYVENSRQAVWEH